MAPRHSHPPRRSQPAAESLHDAFVELRDAARAIEPDSWWLRQTELTTLGYEAIALEVAEKLEESSGPDSGSDSGPPTILDWGAGPGFTTFMLEQLGLSPVYYDFEHDYPSYRFVLDGLHSPKKYIEGDPTRLPFDDATFDGALSCGVLEHVPDPPASLREIHRALKPGGSLFVYHFPNRYSYTEALAGVIGQSNHDVRWSKRTMLRELREAGFEVAWFEYRYMIPRNLIRFPRVRRLFSEHAEGLYRFDRVLSRIPGLNVVANALNCVARKPEA